VLTVDDLDLIIANVVVASEDILHQNKAKHETMYERIEVEMRGLEQALNSSHTMSTAPSSSKAIELGDELT